MIQSSIPGCYEPLAALMELAEVKMSAVQRWSKFRQMPPGTSDQSSGAHCFSLALVVPILQHHLPHGTSFDQARMLRAVLVHDLGEGLLDRDVLYHDKTDAKDADEYRAWCQLIGGFDPVLQRQFKEDFLLQFCLTHYDSQSFDDDARLIMTELGAGYPNEAVAFRILEHLEYLVYGIRQYQDRDHRTIFIEVVDAQLHVLERWAERLPGFLENFWTPELSAWCRAERDKLNGQPAESEHGAS